MQLAICRYISSKCAVGISAKMEKCFHCVNQYFLFTLAQHRIDCLKKSPAVSTNNCSVQRLKCTALDQRKRIEAMEKEFRDNGLVINQTMSNVVDGIARNQTNSSFLQDWLTVQNQTSSKYQRRYPPSVLKYCLQLYAKSPAAYKLLGDVLILPSPSRLRAERNNAGAVQMGVQKDLLERLSQVASSESVNHKRNEIALLMDEMTIKEDLVYRSYANDVIGYCSNGKIADHMLLFYTRGITNPKLDGAIAYFPTRALKYEELFPMVMDVIMQIEMKTEARVYALIADGLSANTSLFDILAQDEADDIKYRMANPIDLSRYIYFIQDPPHLLKCVRNNILNARLCLWNDGYMQWQPIRKLIEDDLALGELRFYPKLTPKHADPNQWEKMNVRIAAQTLSHTVGMALKCDGHESLSKLVLMMDKWFDLMNTSSYHSKRKAKIDLEPYKSNDANSEERLHWLETTFIGYLKDWRKKVSQRDLPSTSSSKCNRSLMLLSRSTEHGLLMTTKSMVELIQVVLQEGANYVATRRINQDPVEAHFGHQRQRGRHCDAPTALMFGHNVRAINCFRSTVPTPLSGSNVNDLPPTDKTT